MNPKQRLVQLLDEPYGDLQKWVKGYIPDHYKRISIDREEQIRLATDGLFALAEEFGKVPYFTQAVIAGAMLSPDYDKITVCACFQYGKSFITGHTSLLMAYRGENVIVASNTSDLTDMIMSNVFSAIRESTEPLKQALMSDSLRKVDKIGTSLSRQKITFNKGGGVESLTLGGMFDDIAHNRAVGKGGVFIIDEAALVPDDAYYETTRREFAKTSGEKNKLVAISNPHNPGWFYDSLTGEASPRHLIVWMDALTAVQEQRWTKEQVLTSELVERNNIDGIIKYLLCELPESGMGMFENPEICDDEVQGVSYIGVDAAYKGKDNVCYARAVFHGGKVHIAEVVRVQKKNWIPGKTSTDIVKQTARVARAYGSPLTCVDVGQGIWLTEGLVKAGVDALGIHFGAGPTPNRVQHKHYTAVNALNKRAEMHLDLQQLIDSGQITFSTEAWEMVKDVWPFITTELNSRGKYKIREKEKIKQMIGRSPDELDAILLAIHAGILDSNRPAYITEGR